MDQKSFILLLLVCILNGINCKPSTCKGDDPSTDADDTCTATEVFCIVDLSGSSSPYRVSGGCSATCSRSADVACCDTTNCNTAVADSAAGNQCVQCIGTTECLASTASGTACPIDSATHCKTTYENGIVVERSCETSCTNSKTTICLPIASGSSSLTPNKLKTCYQCSGSIPCASGSLAPLACPNTAIGCYTEYNIVTGAVTEKGCGSDVISDEDTLEICYEDDCNTKSSLLSCFVCTDADECDAQEDGDDVYCYASLSDVCKTVFNASGIAVRKSCVKAEDCTPDEFTSCCSESGCNTAKSVEQSCYQCKGELSCRLAMPTPCATENATICESIYHTDGIAISKKCVETCTNGVSGGMTTSCCEDDSCNYVYAIADCYQCDDQASCNSDSLEPTSCASSSEDICYTIFLNGVAQEKGCISPNECIEGSNGTLSSTCCRGNGCNEDIINSGNGKYSTNLLVASIFSLLISFKRYFN